jgi:hypothetical protein
MTALTTTAPLSARTFLFGDESVAELKRKFTETDALQDVGDQLIRLGDSVLAAAHDEVATMASGFLDVDLASVAVAAWKKHRELLDASQRTRGTAAVAIVPLGTRDIHLTQRPRIELVVGNTTVTAVKFELKIDIKVIGVAGVVRDSALVALEGGHCELTVSFTTGGVRLGHRTAEFDPHYSIPLGSGIPLSMSRRTGKPAGSGNEPNQPTP